MLGAQPDAGRARQLQRTLGSGVEMPSLQYTDGETIPNFKSDLGSNLPRRIDLEERYVAGIGPSRRDASSLFSDDDR